MGRGSKEGSSQKTRGERQQLQKEERHIHQVTAEVGLGAEPHPESDSLLWSRPLREQWEEHQTASLPYPRPLHPQPQSTGSPAYSLHLSQRTFPDLGSRSDSRLWSTFLPKIIFFHSVTSLPYKRAFGIYYMIPTCCSYLSL